MPKAAHNQPAFNQGEWSPVTYGRADIQARAEALSLCRDFIPLVQGPLTRRPGTWWVAEAKLATVRLQDFQFSVTQAYVLEFGAGYIRFFTNDGQLLDTGVPYEVTTTYTAPELPALYFTQSADVLYIAHPSHPLAKLERQGATTWTLTDVDFQDGPYMPQNVSDTYLSCDVTRVGSTGTLTATAVTGINNDAGFIASDVGRLVRITNTNWDSTSTDNPVKWIQLKITAITDTTHAAVTVVGVVPQAA